MRQSRGREATEAVFAYRQKRLETASPLHTGVRTGCHYLICLSARVSCQCACVTFVVFADCESCTRPISTNPASMEAGEYGLTRGTLFHRTPSRGGRGRGVAVDFVVCFGWGGFFRVFFFDFFFFERTRPAASMRPPCLIYLSTYS